MTSAKGKEVALWYYNLAKTLEKTYEENIYTEWKKNATESAIALLKNNILTNPTPEENKRRVRKDDGKERVAKVKESIQSYVVNFKPELKVIIREAKYLDWIGLDIP